MAKILFLHGLESKPGGKKPAHLRKHGHSVLNPALPKESFEESMKIAQNLVNTERPDFVVGSSRGGAVAVGLETDANVVLIAPAWKTHGPGIRKISQCVILHAPEDKIVPFEDSADFLRTGDLLVSCGIDHRMNDKHALTALADVINEYF